MPSNQLSDQPSLQELNDFFGKDAFASKTTGCTIVEGRKGFGVAELVLTDAHVNAHGKVMGGAIFTLADYALAIASNIGNPPTVNVSSTINYLNASKGSKLIATARCTKDGKRIAFYDVDVIDDLGVDIANISIVAYRMVQP